MENLALRMRARHGHELPRSVEPHGFVPQGSEVTEIPAGSTTKIKDGIRRVALYRVEECCVVLADIVASCAIPESLGKSIVIRDRRVREAPNLLRVIPSGGAVHPPPMFSYCIGSDQALPAMSLRTIGSATVFLLWVSDSLALYARVAVKAFGVKHWRLLRSGDAMHQQHDIPFPSLLEQLRRKKAELHNRCDQPVKRMRRNWCNRRQDKSYGRQKDMPQRSHGRSPVLF